MTIRFIPISGAVVLVLALLGFVLTRGDDRPVSDAPMAPWSDGETPRHIVAFGTSLTAGNGWPDRLGIALRDCFGHAVTVTRVAAPGVGSAWAVEAVPRVIDLAPDVVLVEFAINDADLTDGVSRAVSRRQHDALFRALEQGLPEARVVALTMSPAHGVRGVLRPGLARVYAQVVEVAEQRGLAVIDFYPRWRALDDRALLPDGLHPTDAATERVMDPVLVDAFAQATGHSC